MVKIVVDTNFLLMPYECRIDIVAELCRIVHEPITLIISSGIMNELNTLAGRNGRRAAAARFILQNMDKIRKTIAIETVPSTGEVDRWIIKFVQENRVYVATNDLPLRKKILKLGTRVIAMKGKSKLDFV